MPHPAIDAYIVSYKQKHDYFREAAQLCYDRCRKVLQHNGIRHLASFRAKDEERLREKLYQRAVADGKNYANDADIERDIIDLGGVRIALYFPAQMADAVKVLSEQGEIFHVVEPRTFPKSEQRRGSDLYEYRFTGYEATHLIVMLDGGSLPAEAQRYGSARIEIQVASVFMHAWAEVEHDLVYKPLRGELSIDEYSWLDQVNGLALAGNFALEQLQRTMNARVGQEDRRFAGHYELASFIHSHWPGAKTNELLMGRADKLLPFLARYDLDRPTALRRFLEIVDSSDEKTLVDRLVKRIISAEGSDASERLKAWEEIRDSASPNPYVDRDAVPKEAMIFTAQQRLKKQWDTLDSAVRRILAHADGGTVRASIWLQPDVLKRTLGFDQKMTEAIIVAHQDNTRLKHGSWHGSHEQLEEHERTLRKAIDRLYAEFNDFLREGGIDA